MFSQYSLFIPENEINDACVKLPVTNKSFGNSCHLESFGARLKDSLHVHSHSIIFFIFSFHQRILRYLVFGLMLVFCMGLSKLCA